MAEGVGEFYLSDVLDTSHFEKGYFNVIEAPCGSGKTEAAINKIAPLASKLDKAIYLIDTKLGKDRLGMDSRLTTPYVGYADDVDYAHLFGLETDGKLCVTTYAQFGFWCYRFGRDFTDHYEYIICDEPQNLINFSEIGKKKPTDIPTHRIAREAIDRACWIEKSIVVGITATPEPLNKLSALRKTIPIDRTNLHHYTEKKIIPYASFNSLLENIELGQKGGIYIQHVQPIIRAGKILKARGFNPLMLWSTEYEKTPLTEKQLEARQFLIENERIPPEYDVFLFNATAETSINIRPDSDTGFGWDFFITTGTDDTRITQSRGRYRGDLQIMYVYDKAGAVIVPDDYLNRDLSNKEMGALRDKLGLKKDTKGHPLSIEDMVVLLNDSGYNCEINRGKRKKVFRIIKA